MNIRDITIQEINDAIMHCIITRDELRIKEKKEAVVESIEWKPSVRFKALEDQYDASKKLMGMRINHLIGMTEEKQPIKVCVDHKVDVMSSKEMALQCFKELTASEYEEKSLIIIEQYIVKYNTDRGGGAEL